MRKIQSGPPRCAARCVDGRDVIVYLTVCVEGQPIASERQSIRKIKRAKARAWIIGTELGIGSCRPLTAGSCQAEEASEKAMKRDGFMTLASPDYSSLEAELKVGRGAEAEFLNVNPRIPWIDHVGNVGRGVCFVGRVRNEQVAPKFIN